MKAILSYNQRTTVLKTVSVVQKKCAGVCVNFTNKDDLISEIQKSTPPNNNDAIMSITCGCNRDYIFSNYSDIPANNLTCVCGQLLLAYS